MKVLSHLVCELSQVVGGGLREDIESCKLDVGLFQADILGDQFHGVFDQVSLSTFLHVENKPHGFKQDRVVRVVFVGVFGNLCLSEDFTDLGVDLLDLVAGSLGDR